MRLTVSFGSCSFPRLSPDGAGSRSFRRTREIPKLYVMPARGRRPRTPHVSWRARWRRRSAGAPDGSEIYFVANPTTWYEGETATVCDPRDGGDAARARTRARALVRARAGRANGYRTQCRRPGAMEALSRRNGRRDLGRCEGQRHVRAPSAARRQPVLADVDRRPHLLPRPITKASGTSIRARSTAASCAGTPTRTSTTLAFPRPTASASSTPPAADLVLRHRRRRGLADRSAHALDRAANGAPF